MGLSLCVLDSWTESEREKDPSRKIFFFSSQKEEEDS
jgi:hypothetical protein